MTRRQNPLPPWLPFAVAGVLFLLDFMSSYVRFLLRGQREHYPWWDAGSPILLSPLLWALAAPLLHAIYRRLAWRPLRLVRTWLLWFVFAAIGGALHEVVAAAIMLAPYAVHDPERAAAMLESFVPNILWWCTKGAVQLGLILGAFAAFDLHRRWRDGRIAAAEMEKQLVEAQLQALRMQLNPHFLFNALHTVGSLMETRVDDAQTVLAKLGKLLRRMLEADREPCVPLSDEMEILQDYLGIEQIRFGDRLSVVYDIQPEAESALVPQLILQPLVENALKHGISHTPGPGTITLGARIDGEDLELVVRDDGDGATAQAITGGGVGLHNTRARLSHLYGEQGRLDIRNPEDGGFLVEVRLPLRQAATGEEVRRWPR